MSSNISQVEFSDSSRSVELLAVQVNEGSSYMAEDTSFVGFQAEVRVESSSLSVLLPSVPQFRGVCCPSEHHVNISSPIDVPPFKR